MKRIIAIFLWLFSCFCVNHASAQLLALKTNALLDVAMVPNLGMELVIGEKTSLNASAFGSVKIYGNEVKTLGAQGEMRYWFNGRPLTREFIGIAGSAIAHNIVWRGQRYRGDAYVAALTFGYAFVLAPHWTLELHSGIGLMGYHQKRYYLGDRVHDNNYNARGLMLIPYNLGVTFSWIIK